MGGRGKLGVIALSKMRAGAAVVNHQVETNRIPIPLSLLSSATQHLYSEVVVPIAADSFARSISVMD